MKNTFRLSLLVVLTLLLWTVGCRTGAPDHDPLAGWRFEDHNPDQTIDQDYRDYIQHLPPEEKRSAGPVHFLTD